MTAKRFELKIPLDLLEKIEDAAHDYFQSPINHTSKKPELTSPILKLIEKGLEKIAELPDPNLVQIDTDNLNELIDEKIKAHLSVYKLDELQTAIDKLSQVVFDSGNHQTMTVSNTDCGEIVTPDVVSDSKGNGSFSFELSESTVEENDPQPPQVQQDKSEREDLGDKETLKCDDSPVSIDLPSVNPTQIEPVLSPDKSEISDTQESMDNHNTTLITSPDSIQAVSVDNEPIDDPKGIEKASTVGIESVYSPDITGTDTTLINGGLKKSLATGAKITLKGAWRHALDFGFNGSVDEFARLFKRKGDVHYGVKVLYFSRASNSRNYELLE